MRWRVCTTTWFIGETAFSKFFTRQFVTLASSCQRWSQSPLWKIIQIDYFHVFSSFMKLMWSCYEDFMAWTSPKAGKQSAAREKKKGGGFVPFDPIQAGCLSKMTVQKWLHKCFHSSVITECENEVRLRWNQAWILGGEITNICNNFICKNIHINVFFCQILKKYHCSLYW